MIRPLEEKDIDTVCGIVNENWKNVYSGYVTSAAAKFRWMCSKDTPIKDRFCRSQTVRVCVGGRKPSVGNVVFWRYGRCGYGRGI